MGGRLEWNQLTFMDCLNCHALFVAMSALRFHRRGYLKLGKIARDQRAARLRVVRRASQRSRPVGHHSVERLAPGERSVSFGRHECDSLPPLQNRAAGPRRRSWSIGSQPQMLCRENSQKQRNNRWSPGDEARTRSKCPDLADFPSGPRSPDHRSYLIRGLSPDAFQGGLHFDPRPRSVCGGPEPLNFRVRL
jgi:hypothetical protein